MTCKKKREKNEEKIIMNERSHRSIFLIVHFFSKSRIDHVK